MRTKKNIAPRNEKGESHGYWECYYSNGQLYYKGNYVNGIKDGYWEEYFYTGKLLCKGKFVKDNIVGFWIENGKEVFYAN